MKVAILNLDWIPVIPGGKLVGETERHDMRDTTCFRADDGWTITRLPDGDFEVDREGLPAPVVIGDGYAFTRAPIEVVDTEAPVSAAALDGQSSQQALSRKRAKR